VSFEISLLIGLVIGAGYAIARRMSATSHVQPVGGAMLLKWPRGIGRVSVLEIKAGNMRLSPPVMRASYTPPEPGTELLLKPLDGGPVRRAKLLGHGDAGWTVRLG